MIMQDKASSQILSMKQLPPLKNSPNLMQSKLNCNLCAKLALSHFFCNNCKKIFCMDCIKISGHETNDCPICEFKSSLVIREEKKLLNKKNSLLKCTYCNEGCTSTFQSMVEFHESNCQFRPYKCPNEFCTASNLQQKDAESHQLVCAFKVVNCKSCHQKIKFKEYEKHKSICTARLKIDYHPNLKPIISKQILLPKLDYCFNCKTKYKATDLKKCSNCHKYLCPSCSKDCLICKKGLNNTFTLYNSCDSNSIPNLNITSFFNSRTKLSISQRNNLNLNANL